ncbi:MAG: DUF1501 domain-containing protein [Pirellulaceae bacterium]
MREEQTCHRVASPSLSRRDLLRRTSLGVGTAALAALMRDEGLLQAADGRPLPSRGANKVRSVVYFFLGGGPSQVDTFDPKPLLAQLAGNRVPDSIAKDIPRIARAPLVNLLPSPWKFRPCGQSGIPVSDLFPHLRRHVDDLCILRSCSHDSPIHAPAEFLTMTGSLAGDRPSLGAWLTYGLGSENQNLPGFIMFKTGDTLRPPALAAGFLPARYQGVLVDIERGIPNVDLPHGVSARQREAQLEFINRWNREHFQRNAEQSELEARIRSYELAFRMQMAAPEAFRMEDETEQTQRAYGVGQEHTDAYGRILLQTRRLVERGVRFIFVRSGGWDFHSEIAVKQLDKCRATDQPLAAFIADLKQRGLFDETLVIWGGEFGRTPAAQGTGNKVGRDHSPSGYSMWLAGGGVRGGQVIGRTDPVGYAAIQRPIHPNDLHATILQAMGIDQHRLYYDRHNRREIVTVNGGQVIEEALS